MTADPPPPDDLPPPRVEEVSDNVFAYIQPDGTWGLNNTGFILADDAVLAIDACMTERRTRGLLDAIRRHAGPRPVRTLVNTHHHADHTFGNWLFRPEATIVAHERCRETMLREGAATKAFWPDVDFGEVRIAPPDITFDGRLCLWAGDLRLDLIDVAPAHTDNDIVAWLPQQRVLFAGDVIFNGGTPFALAGSIDGWLEALDVIRALGAERIVPGHGPVAGPEVIDDVAAYLRFVLDAARDGYAAGAAPLDVARALDLGRFAAWTDPERLAANLHRAYSELRGDPRATPLPPDAIRDMLALNNGPPRSRA